MRTTRAEIWLHDIGVLIVLVGAGLICFASLNGSRNMVPPPYYYFGLAGMIMATFGWLLTAIVGGMVSRRQDGESKDDPSASISLVGAPSGRFRRPKWRRQKADPAIAPPSDRG